MTNPSINSGNVLNALLDQFQVGLQFGFATRSPIRYRIGHKLLEAYFNKTEDELDEEIKTLLALIANDRRQIIVDFTKDRLVIRTILTSSLGDMVRSAISSKA